MMRKRIRVISVICLMAMLFSCFSSCKEDTPVENSDPKEYIDVIANKFSNYVLVYDRNDPLASYFTESLWKILYQNCGVALKKEDDEKTFDYEIVLCDAARSGVAELKSSMDGQSEFAIALKDNRLYLYTATHSGVKGLLLAVQELLLSGEEKEKRFAVEKDRLYLSSELQLNPNTATLFNGTEASYKIIYNSENEDEEKVAYFLRRQLKNAFGVNFNIGTERDKETEHEILVGISGIKRDEFSATKKLIRSADDFMISVVGTKVVIAAADAASLALAAECFLVRYAPSEGGLFQITETQEYLHSLDKSFSVTRDRLEYLYSDVLKRYPTLREYYWATRTSQSAREDQKMIEALIEAMGESAVFFHGSSSVLYNGMIRKLNTDDYGKTASLGATSADVPAQFVNTYLKTSYAADFVDLKQAAEQAGYTYYYDAARKLAIVSPKGVWSFADDAASAGGYTNASLKDRMAAFFQNEEMPEPQNNTEQSRVVIEDAVDYYPEDALDFMEPTYYCGYSPSIVSVKQKDGSTILYTSAERCKLTYGSELTSNTYIRQSTDGGLTWTLTHTFYKLKWATLFEVNGKVYVFGYVKPSETSLTGYSAIAEVTDKSCPAVLRQLWTNTTSVFEPMVIGDYLYLALDDGIASIPLTDDLTAATNWTVTNEPGDLVTKAWFQNMTGKTLGQWGIGDAYCQEGNIVEKNGEIYVIYRTESQPYGNYGIMLKLSEDRKRIEFLENEKDSIIQLPTTVSRFVIKYDAVSGLYVMVSNWWMTENACRARNVLGLSVSKDLVSWTKVDTLLVDREMMNSEYSCWAHAFQYADFDFDGDDLVMTVRETTGFSNTFHDGKYYTFYRVTNFRSMLP